MIKLISPFIANPIYSINKSQSITAAFNNLSIAVRIMDAFFACIVINFAIYSSVRFLPLMAQAGNSWHSARSLLSVAQLRAVVPSPNCLPSAAAALLSRTPSGHQT